MLSLVWTVALLAQSALDQAITFTRQQRYAEARQAMRDVLEPADARQRVVWHRVRAAIAAGLQEHPLAAREMRAALVLAPADGGLLLATAAAELAAGEWDNALQHAQEAGSSAAAAALTGDIQEKRGAYVEAAQAYQTAVTLAPNREEYRLTLALELVQHQTFRAAIEVLQQAAPLFPRSARIRTLLGVAHYALGNNEAAQTALTDAIQIDPALTPAYSYLARIVLESSAAPPSSTAQALCRWNPVVCAALRVRQARESNDSALLQQATRTLAQAPADQALARCELGRAYQWSGDWPLARTAMEACVQLDPTPQNRYRLALVYRQLGEEALARQQLAAREQAIKQLSEEGVRRLEAVQAFRYSLK